jgi:probable phosphoglycerate mutase
METFKTTKLVFVRHGESEKNILKIKSSTKDKWPLTEKGRSHAETIAQNLSTMGTFDIIISSPILRARQTAEIISERLNLPIVFDDSIGEYEYGNWNDLTHEEMSRKHQDYLEYKKHEKGTQEHFNFKLGGAESRSDVVVRIRNFLEKIKKEYSGKNLIVVSHGGINGAIEMVLNNSDLETFYKKESIGHQEIETFLM